MKTDYYYYGIGALLLAAAAYMFIKNKKAGDAPKDQKDPNTNTNNGANTGTTTKPAAIAGTGDDQTATLKKGMKGTYVLQLQRGLNQVRDAPTLPSASYIHPAKIAEDGNFGTGTENMLNHYTGAKTFTPIYGQHTYIALAAKVRPAIFSKPIA